jgi:hypothetical protein
MEQVPASPLSWLEPLCHSPGLLLCTKDKIAYYNVNSRNRMRLKSCLFA